MELKIVEVDIKELKPAEINPRKITDKDKKELQDSLKKFGCVDPLIVNYYKKRKNVIIGGHQRYYILKELGLRFYVSDSHCKDFSHNACCCGLPESWSYSKIHFAEALMKAKRQGKICFNDISFKEYKKYNLGQSGINYHYLNIKQWSIYKNLTACDFFRYYWNNLKSGKGMYQYFNRVLKPTGKDKNGDMIFEYNGVKTE